MFRCYSGLAETLLIFKVVSADFFSSLSSCGGKLAVTVWIIWRTAKFSSVPFNKEKLGQSSAPHCENLEGCQGPFLSLSHRWKHKKIGSKRINVLNISVCFLFTATNEMFVSLQCTILEISCERWEMLTVYISTWVRFPSWPNIT